MSSKQINFLLSLLESFHRLKRPRLPLNSLEFQKERCIVN